MARASSTGGKKAKASLRKASPAKGRKAAKTKRGVALKRPKSRTVEARLRLETRELREAVAQQAATAEVLQVISNSPGDLALVFDTLLDKAMQLCGAEFGVLGNYDGKAFQTAASRGLPAKYAAHRARSSGEYGPGTAPYRHLQGEPIVHIVDLKDSDAYRAGEPNRRALVDLGRARCLLCVPLLSGRRVIGSVMIFRQQARPFSDQQIALLKHFAAQAAIAIENARLLQELRARTDDLAESLRQQTATADVLKVISRSAFDIQTVLNTLTESAARLSEANSSHIYLVDGEIAKLAACSGFSKEYEDLLRRTPLTAGRGTLIGRTLLEGRVVHLHDAVADKEYEFLEARKLGRFRTMLGIPMLRDHSTIGVLAVTRSEVRPFTDKQIELLHTFADQAVIAIENVRLFEEVETKTRDLEESLQQQTATADVLKVISRSAFDLDTVLTTLVESAARLCEAERGLIFLRRADHFHMSANFGFSPELEAFARAHPMPVDGSSTTARAAAAGIAVQAVDVLADQTQGELARRYQQLGGHRTNLGVPLRREGQTIGVFTLTRQVVREFTERQIELVSTFADQAVIAIENARLFDEVQAKTRDLEESLQQQTATADVLKAISRSTFDLPAVLHALVETAARLCGADKGTITRQKEGSFYRAESFGFSAEFMDLVRDAPVVVDRHTATGRALLERVVIHIPDVEGDRDYKFSEGQRIGDFRSLLGVPMLREGNAVGVITLTRTEPRGFSDKQIELAVTFADQAAIAIENVRLFDEVQARTRELAKSLEDLRTAQDRLIETEKLASLGQLTAGIAHEIKNPLNFVNNFSSLSTELIDELNDALKEVSLNDKMREEIDELTSMLKSNLEKVVQHGKRADSIVKNMLLHSREGTGERRSADINAIVEESLNLAYHGARAEKAGFNITLERDLDPAAGMIDLYPQEITRVLLNLISNGFYAATKRRETSENDFEPTLGAVTKNLGNEVEIRIRDNGTGIPPAVREKIFNPFFTTKPAGEGTGLGLSMSHDIIVKQHGGKIDLMTEPGAFTEFIITLPREAAAKGNTGG